MKFARKLYVTEGIKDSKSLRFKLKHGKKWRGLYVIVLSPGRDELEIYHCGLLRQSYYRNYPLWVVGLAGSREEAFELVGQIVEDIYAKTGQYKIKEYLKQQFHK